jgi:hypothetical protein
MPRIAVRACGRDSTTIFVFDLTVLPRQARTTNERLESTWHALLKNGDECGVCVIRHVCRRARHVCCTARHVCCTARSNVTRSNRGRSLCLERIKGRDPFGGRRVHVLTVVMVWSSIPGARSKRESTRQPSLGLEIWIRRSRFFLGRRATGARRHARCTFTEKLSDPYT